MTAPHLLGGPDLSHLSPAKRALLAARLKGRAETAAPDLPAAPAVLGAWPDLHHAPYRAREFVRERLRFAGPGGGDFRLFMETRFRGLDTDRFRAAWRVLHQRYDILRSRIDGEDLVVAPPEDGDENGGGVSFFIPHHDARTLPPADGEAVLEAARRRLRDGAGAGVRPAVEILLVGLPDDVTVCLFSFDLLVMDLPSVEFLALRCRRVYEGQPLRETRFAVQDYRRTEDAWLASADGDRAARHWDKRIAEAGPRLAARHLVPGGAAGEDAYGYLCRNTPRAVWSAGRAAAAARGVNELVAVQVLFTDLLRLLSGRDHFAYEARGFQRLPFHREIHELLGQFTLGHPTGSRPAEGSVRFVDRVAAEAALIDRNTPFAHFDAASRWAGGEPPGERGGKIVFTNTCNRFEEFVLAGSVPPMRWYGSYESIFQTLPDTALEYVLVENDGDLENHWFLNHRHVPAAWAARVHALYCDALHHLCATPAAWEASCVFTAAFGAAGLRERMP